MHVFGPFSLFLSLLVLNFTKSNAAYLPHGYVLGKSCNRVCNDSNLKCYFDFTIETLYTSTTACSSPDCIIVGGAPRTVTVINRQFPGPSIEVCKGDTVTVQIENKLQNRQSTTIHFHGINMRGIDAYSDGVPYVTQCPVNYNNKFSYSFLASKTGTYWYHSHVKTQFADGLFGPLIVREIERNYHRKLYDKSLSKHVILVGDWSSRPQLDLSKGYLLDGALTEPTGILINGKGYQLHDNITNTLLANFIVHKNLRYRFRLINVGFLSCPVEFSIDDHTLTIIAMDGYATSATSVDSFIASTGERFDFVIHANQRVATYWIRIKGYVACNSGLYTVATLQYSKSNNSIPLTPVPTYEDAAPTGGILLNPISAKSAKDSGLYKKVLTVADLRAFHTVPRGFNHKTIHQHYITLDMSLLDDPAFQERNESARLLMPQLNHISYQAFDRPLLPNRNKFSCDQFCDESTLKNSDCLTNLCQFLHLIQVPLQSLVEFVFIDEWIQNDVRVLHSIHLHGHTFRVLGSGEGGRNFTKDKAISMDTNSTLPRNYKFPPYKDTVSIPKGGYTIVRFIADNPGYWFMHCHTGFDASEGMSLVLKVGLNREMPEPPPNFPKCGNWNPLE